jgi:F0F1-type ATP synthase membrane subunit b/b'
VTKLLDERAKAVRDDIDSAHRRREEAEGLHADARAELATKMLGRAVTAADHERLVGEFLKGLESSKGAGA